MEGRGHGKKCDRVCGVWLGLFLACATVGCEVEARAQYSPTAEEASAGPAGYTEAIQEAIDHYSAGRWRQAQEAFTRAHALQPSARTYRGLGLSTFYLGDFAAARAAFEQALADTRRPLPEDQKAQLAELLLEAARMTGRIELNVAPASARVELDGVAVEKGVLFVDRGEHVLSVSADGYVPERSTLAIEGGEQRSLDLVLEQQAPATSLPVALPAPVAAATPLAPSTADPSVGAPPARPRVLTWIAAAAVPVFAGTATVVWLTGKAERDQVEEDCIRDACDEREAQRRLDRAGVDAHETWTNVALAASGAALVAATILFFVEGQGGSEPQIELTAARSGAALQTRF